jgi:hypothetical protein
MLFDTDVIIWVFRGNAKALREIEGAETREISVVTYLELLQGAHDQKELRAIKAFLADAAFGIVPLTENIGHRASIYMEEYGLRGGMAMADALLAATAVENQSTLCTGNRKHYRLVKELDLRVFTA